MSVDPLEALEERCAEVAMLMQHMFSESARDANDETGSTVSGPLPSRLMAARGRRAGEPPTGDHSVRPNG